VIETDNVDVEGGTTTGVFSHTVLLPAGTTIYYRAYATSIIGTGYSAEDSFTTETEPTVQASNITFPQVAGGSMRIAWTRGNGDGCIVVLRLTATDITAPLDGDDYAANTDYTLAPELPVSSQNYVVYKGASSYLLVTGLGQSVSYSVAIYEYAGTGAGTDYLQLDPAVATRTTTDTLVHNMDYGINVCTKCHNAHGGFFYARDTELKAVCETCHIALGQAAAKLEFDNHLTPSKNPGIDYIDCGVCHELHNPGGANTTESTHSVTLETQDNKSFLRANVNKYVATSSPPAVLHTDVPKREDPHPDGPRPADTPDRAIEGGDDATARGFCQVCHTMTSYHRSSNTAGADQCHNGDTGNCGAAETHCGECHEHNNRFIGVGGTVTCVECHDAPADPLPRPITTTQFDRVSTHIPGGSAVTTEEDCLVCHDQGAHKAQAVIVWDLDDGLTSYTQPTPGASTLNTGEGELFEVHCMSCHADRNADSLPTSGSDQTQTSPFTGSDLTPTNLEIDATAWTSAGHNRPSGTFPSSPVTCVGNGTNGCHASGHGSDNLDLLAPATGPVISAADGCYVCHDADGPSSHNTRAQFETASNYQVEAGSGALVNQRHDITAADQAYSGGVVSCKDCHLVHVDNGANPVVDPDTGLPLANYSTANSYTDDGHNFPYDSGGNLDPVNPVGSVGGPYTEPDYIQFCLTCHDDDGSGNMLPPGVTMSSGMLDIASEYVSQDQHGGGDGNTGSKTSKGGLKAPYVNASDDAANNDPPSSYAAMNCSDCHGAHGTGSIFNLRESITIGGVVLTVGGGGGVNPGVLDEPHYFGSATYSLPLIDGAQKDHYWGAWCTFCHKADTHPDKDEAEACTNGHMHGGGSF
jgi:hypothetical protein